MDILVSICQLYTDHKALRSLRNTPHSSGKLGKWGLTIQELDIHIHHHSRKTNQVADLLSHLQLWIKTEIKSQEQDTL